MNEHADVKAIYPIHMNPLVREVAAQELGGCDRVHIIEPLDVLDFHNFLAKSYMILTDSGGIQEEAPSLGKPVLVMRNTTERPEGVEAGTFTTKWPMPATHMAMALPARELQIYWKRVCNQFPNERTTMNFNFSEYEKKCDEPQ